MIWLSVWAGILFATVILALRGVLPYVFTTTSSWSSRHRRSSSC